MRNPDPLVTLPRGPHGLTREEVAASQRTRLMAAMTELVAQGGFGAVTVGALARSAAVSRAAFYEHFAGKEACLLAAYDDFARRLAEAMTAEVDDDTPWEAFVDATLDGYVATIRDDPTSARAFLVEMDGAGPAARRRRHEAIEAFAALLADRHAAIRGRDRSLGPLPQRVYLGTALGVRELAREALEHDPRPDWAALARDVRVWIAAVVAGAASAR